ncbi:hypothetical protein [Tsuneonella amylolytica]|uniref:hypothetical protein n=1 Tax=Tsuneonella amylolytica TaxID=2338327 RepID=UPI000EA8AB5A|nr:hypothetical protein [Tsuneonella amylolytica]
MGIAKRPKLATSYSGPRAGEREAVSLDAVCRVGDGEPFAVAVLDLDARGCRVRGFGAAATKADPIILTLGTVHSIVARLRWAKRGSAGLRFDEPLSEDRLAEASESATPAPPSRVIPIRRAP